MQQGAIITPEVQEFLTGLLKYRWIKNIYRFLCLVGNIIGFFLNGHAIVALGYWVVMVAGRISESALLFATLWITADNVAPDFMTKVVRGSQNADMLTNLSILAFSLLPEVIVFSAIIITYEHWHSFFSDRRWLNPSWVWGTLYTAPTLTFLTMTVITLSSFVASGTHTPHATGLALVVRCLAGWSYSIIGLIYSRIGKRPYAQTGQQNATVQTPDYSQLLIEMRTQIQAEMQQSLTSFRVEIGSQIDSKIVAPEPMNYDAIVRKMMPVIEAKLSGLETAINGRIPAHLNYDDPASQVASVFTTVNTESKADDQVEILELSEAETLEETLDESLEQDTEALNNVVPLHAVPPLNKSRVPSKASTKSPGKAMSEAERKVRLYLKRNNMTAVAIAKKVGVTSGYVSQIKRKMQSA